MSKVRRSLWVTLSQNYLLMPVQLISSVIVARLLSPAEIGVFSVAIVLTSFAHTLRDFGAADYVVQEKDLTPARLRSAFGLTLVTAWLLALVLLLASGPAAAFYAEPVVADVMRVLSLNFALIPFGAVTLATLRREMDFYRLAVVKVSGSLTSHVATVGLALWGLGTMSMAWGAVAGVVMTIALAARYRPKSLPWLPGFSEWRRVFGFGTFSSAGTLVGDLGRGAPELILGRALDMTAVGLYGRATGLIEIFNRAVMGAVWMVALPYFSQDARAGGDLRASFVRAACFITGLSWPFFAVLAVTAYPVIHLLYGPQWDASAPLVKYLCVAAALTSPFWLTGSVLIADGRVRENFRAMTLAVVVKIAMLLAGASLGLEAFAAAAALAALSSAVIYFFTLRRALGLRLKDLTGATARSALVTVTTAAGPLALAWLQPFGADRLWPFLFTALALAAVGWLAGVFAFNHPIRAEMLRAADGLRARFRPASLKRPA